MGLAFFVRSSAAHFLFCRKEGTAVLIPENLEETILHLRENDTQCQELLKKSCALSEKYFQVLEALDPADRVCVQQYRELCEDLEDRTLQLIAAHYAVNGTNVLVNTQG